MQLAIDIKNPMRERLLKNHRLEAVMSMPDDLFYPVGVVTCIRVFTAHVPHESDPHHESWFGFWKEDGFRKDKVQGRIPKSEEMWKEKKDSWIGMFRRKEVAGKSVWKKVANYDEWCAEAYLETDYSDVTEDMFAKELKRHAMFVQFNDL
jgi:type I restriction-modification system DNA methylase subunit